MNWAVKRLIINEEIHMGKKINIEASDEPCMFQFFKKYIHQTDKNEFYCDNRVVDISNPNPGVVVDFKILITLMKYLQYLEIIGEDGTLRRQQQRCIIELRNGKSDLARR